ncbi:hypothetical protein EYF80_016948 [Liparis tanakae]|uniref:Uncharacterized protein n=1 Tax=Liparis tanakae TaxID=230148 RepID=A0A4Z2I4B3_9TELE|nr:hypothetical protein EYF80_016948 [Liparis tanakae]
MWPSVIPNEQVTVAPEPSEQCEDAFCMKEGCDVALPPVHPPPLGQPEAPVHDHAREAGPRVSWQTVHGGASWKFQCNHFVRLVPPGLPQRNEQRPLAAEGRHRTAAPARLQLEAPTVDVFLHFLSVHLNPLDADDLTACLHTLYDAKQRIERWARVTPLYRRCNGIIDGPVTLPNHIMESY